MGNLGTDTGGTAVRRTTAHADLRSLWSRSRPTTPGDPGGVAALVVAGFVLLPSTVVPTKVSWALLAVCLALVVNAALAARSRVRPTLSVAAFAAAVMVGLLTVQHTEGLTDLVVGAGRSVLLVGLALLVTACGTADRRRLVNGLLLLAAVELTAAAASAFAGVPAPWGYLGRPGSLFGVNELLPALGGRATGTMAHPIPFGLLMAVAVSLAAFASPHLRPWARWAAAAAGTGGVLLSGSRSAALVLVVALVVGSLVQRRGRHTTARRALAVVAVVLAVPALDVRELSIFSSLEGTGSLTHRLGSFEAALRLLDRPVGEVVLGSGTDSLSYLFTAGYLQQDGFFAVDNQFVTTFATSGLLGLVALVVALGAAALRGDRATRSALVVVASMFFSFDVLLWPSCAVLVAVLVGLRRDDASVETGGAARSGQAEPDPDEDERALR